MDVKGKRKADQGFPPPDSRMAVNSAAAMPVRFAAPAGATIGTTWSARLVLPASVTAQKARATIQRALDDVVAQMSHWDNSSDLSRFNRAPSGWHSVPGALFHVMRYAIWLAGATDGAYDPALGTLVQAWGFGPGARHQSPPAPALLDEWRGRAGWRALRLDPATQRMWQPGGVVLDLSSIAKGYGVDAAAGALDTLGLRHYLIEVGGELRVRGRRPDCQNWHVAIESPDAAGPALTLPLRGGALATSGDYQHYYVHESRRYAHTMDPRSGLPLDNGVASVSVLHHSCMQADALATALLVLGAQAGMGWAETHGVAAVFQLRDSNNGDGNRILFTRAFRALLQGERPPGPPGPPSG